MPNDDLDYSQGQSDLTPDALEAIRRAYMPVSKMGQSFQPQGYTPYKPTPEGLLEATGPLGEAGTALGESLRTGHFDTRDLAPAATGVMVGIAGPKSEAAVGPASHLIGSAGRRLVKSVEEAVPDVVQSGMPSKLSGNEGLAYLLKPRSGADVIGQESGVVKPNGISVLSVANAPAGYGGDRLVYTRDGQIVGAMQVMKSPTAGQQIANTYVHPDFRRQGIATELNKFAEQKYGPLSRSEDPSEQGQAFRESLKRPFEKAAPEVSSSIKAYHGSPYDFDRFDISKIGTGEGAQAYGHGLYFAENPEVAADYKNSLSRTKPWEYEGKPVTQYSNDETIPYHVKQAVGWLEGNQRPGESVADLIARRSKQLSDHAEFMRNSSNAADQYAAGMYDSAVDVLNRVDTEKLKAPTGKTYEVNINADPAHFLDWDKPLSEQSNKYHEFINSAPWRRYMLSDEYKGRQLGDVDRNLQSAEYVQKLRDAGIPGIKYLDQGSRPDMAAYQKAMQDVADLKAKGHPDWAAERQKEADAIRGSITSNYVVFDDKLIDIIKKYGLAGAIGAPAIAAAIRRRQAEESSQ